MRITISPGAESVLGRLLGAGYDAYIVGGAVRDSVMGKTAHDYDIATNALPENVKKLFKTTIDTGLEHGTVTVVENGVGYEVTTFRTETGFSDARHPDTVSFVSSVTEDLRRRDFTINAMCYRPDTGIVDCFGGLSDIAARLVRCVGIPEKRFCEDALRMLRAVRFAACLGFELESETAAATKKCAPLIKRVSAERIQSEMNKILLSDNPGIIKLMHKLGLLQYIMPELGVCFGTPQRNKYHIYDVGDHIVAATCAIEKNLTLRWAALLHDIGKPNCLSTDSAGIIHFYGHHRESVSIARDILHRLRFDNDTSRDILLLVENHDVRIEPSPPAVKRILEKIGAQLFPQLLSLQIADNRAKNSEFFPEKLARIEEVRRVFEYVIADAQPYLVSDLVVNGRDLIKIGFRAGREIGDTLKLLLGEVIISPELNKRDYLLKRAAELRRKK